MEWLRPTFAARRDVKKHKLQEAVRLISISALAYLAQFWSAEASFYCQKIEQLPTVTDERVLGRLQIYVTSLSGVKPFQIKQLTSRFFLVIPEGENCKVAACYYRLLDSKDIEAKERFSFRGRGTFWFYSTPAEVRIEEYGDYYTEYGFETSTRAHVRVLLPRTAETVVVNGVSPDEVLPKACGDQSR